MNLKLDGPTCKTIWSCHFERDESGVLKKTIKCTEICEKLQCIIGNDKIVILFSWLKTLKAFESANYETVKITARNNLYQDRIDKIFKIFKLFKWLKCNCSTNYFINLNKLNHFSYCTRLVQSKQADYKLMISSLTLQDK